MKHARIFLKLGGSILTDKTRPEAIDAPTLQRIAVVLAQAQHDTVMQVVIGHGGGSFGHYWAERYGTQHGARDVEGWHGVARVSDAMGRLNRIVVAALLEAGVGAVGVQPLASARAVGGRLTYLATPPIEGLLEAGLTPVVHGDVVLDDQQGAAIISTEALFAYLAPRLSPHRIILLGEAGVFTADPRRDPQAERIDQITSANIEAVLRQTGASHGTDVTGGMAAKVRQMWELVQAVPGLEVQLIGTQPDVIRSALRGEATGEGTTIKV